MADGDKTCRVLVTSNVQLCQQNRIEATLAAEHDGAAAERVRGIEQVARGSAAGKSLLAHGNFVACTW